MKRIAEFIAITYLSMVAVECLAQEEKIEPRIGISYYKKGDDVPYIKVLVRKRVERRYYPMQGLTVTGYFLEESDEQKMGTATTNEKGEGTIEMPVELMKGWHDNNEFDFIVTIPGSDSTEEANESITITKAHIDISGDDEHNIKARLTSVADSAWEAVPEVEVKVFVQRSFGRLPITEDYLETDEDGNVEVLFERELPGDKDGMLTIGAMIEDHDEFGNVFAYTLKKWGRPLVDDNSAFEERTLWSTRDKTPYWLLIFPNMIILGVWGVIVYLVLQIFKIRRLSNQD